MLDARPNAVHHNDKPTQEVQVGTAAGVQTDEHLFDSFMRPLPPAQCWQPTSVMRHAPTLQNVLAAVKSVQLPLASRQALYEQLAAKGFSTGGACSHCADALPSSMATP